MQLLIGLVVILTTNFLVIGGIIFTIHLLLIPWLVAYIVGQQIREYSNITPGEGGGSEIREAFMKKKFEDW